MSIKPRFVVIRFKLTEEGNYSIHRTHIINITPNVLLIQRMERTTLADALAVG
jgi:hypothetical protein